MLVGGADGVAGAYSISQNRVLQVLKGGGGAITDALWVGSKAVVSTAAGRVKIFEGQSELKTFRNHAGNVTGIALHPSGSILASVGADKSYVLYDLEALTPITQIYTDSSTMHTLTLTDSVLTRP